MSDGSPLPTDASVRIACTCGHSRVYPTTDELTTSGGSLRYHEGDRVFSAVCPACEEYRPAKVGVFEFEDVDDAAVVLGEFEDGYAPREREAGYDRARTEFPSLDPIQLEQQRFSPSCSRCQTLLTENDIHAGPDAPEVGWEYYECPDCEHRMRPESVN